MNKVPDMATCQADFLQDTDENAFTESLLERLNLNIDNRKSAAAQIYSGLWVKLMSINSSDLYRLRKFYSCLGESGWKAVPQLAGPGSDGFWSIAYKKNRSILIIGSMSASHAENEKLPVVLLSNLPAG